MVEPSDWYKPDGAFPDSSNTPQLAMAEAGAGQHSFAGKQCAMRCRDGVACEENAQTFLIW